MRARQNASRVAAVGPKPFIRLAAEDETVPLKRLLIRDDVKLAERYFRDASEKCGCVQNKLDHPR